MPPRYAYWTILIDDKATAFRAREREELQPTFAQLQRKNANVTMRWFARGKLFVHGGRQAFAVRAADCHACGLCVKACPERAIRLEAVA